MMALVPAGGQSTRMGRPKLLLPLGERTVLEHVIASLRVAEVAPILVVVASHLPQLATVAEQAGADALLLSEATPDMRTTVERGLRWLEERLHPRPDDGWLLVPADHPTLDAAVVRSLVEARARYPERSIFIPTFQGRRGHPTLIAWQHVPGMRSLPAGEGLNLYLRQQAAQTLEVPVLSADVLCDLDTPEDYERLVQRFREP
jgi:molybdenum cofactor cytidylyltransferase